MRVYLASRFSDKAKTKKYAEELAEINIECTSRWLDEKVSANTTLDKHTDSYLLNTAITDLEDMDRADVVVLFSVDPKEPTPRGGRHFESGYAYGSGKPLYVVGPKENIFHYLSNVRVFENFEECKQALLAGRVARRVRPDNIGGYATAARY